MACMTSFPFCLQDKRGCIKCSTTWGFTITLKKKIELVRLNKIVLTIVVILFVIINTSTAPVGSWKEVFSLAVITARKLFVNMHLVIDNSGYILTSTAWCIKATWSGQNYPSFATTI